jgi:hypothetical protein
MASLNRMTHQSSAAESPQERGVTTRMLEIFGKTDSRSRVWARNLAAGTNHCKATPK